MRGVHVDQGSREMSEQLGILGALTPTDIAEAFERVRQRDAIEEAESNVIYGIAFGRRGK